MATTTRTRSRQTEPPQPPPEQPSTHGLAFGTQLLIFLSTLLTLIGGLVTAATGIISPSGGSFFASPAFWGFYALLLITIAAVTANVIALTMRRRSWVARGFTLPAAAAPAGYYVFSNLFGLLLFVPYIFAMGSIANQAETGGPMTLVVLVAIAGGVGGGAFTGWLAFEFDKMNHPWDYHQG